MNRLIFTNLGYSNFQLYYILIEEQMTDKVNLGRVNYSLVKHHKEHLRQQIDQKLIQKIEVHPEPSRNYWKAYQNVYQDELEKTVYYHDQKKRREKMMQGIESQYIQKSLVRHQGGTLPVEEFQLSNRHEDELKPVTSISSRAPLESDLSVFQDYDIQKRKKIDQHVNVNFDNGESFFKEHDSYLLRKKRQMDIAQSTVINQMNLKQNQKLEQKQRKMYQLYVLSMNKSRQAEMESHKLHDQKINQAEYRNQMLIEMQKQKRRKERRSKFELNHIGRHNPITNPIQYHIDNPYILSKMQKFKDRIL